MFRLAIVGVGPWGKRLIGAVQGKSDRVEFAAAATRTPAKVADFMAGHGIPVGDDFAAVMTDPGVDGVVVAAPSFMHAALTMQAIEAGKHVLCVKPLSAGKAEAEELFDAARRKGVFLAMGYERCFLPGADELRRRVRSGALGRMVHVEGAYCVDRYLAMTRDDWKADNSVAPPGALADHILYMMIELVGPVEELHARGLHLATDLSASDTCTVTMRLAGGVSAQMTAIGVTPAFSRLHFFGTEGWAELRGAGRFEFQPSKGEPTVIEFPPFDTLRAQLESFAAAARGEAEFPLSPEQVIAASAAMEAMARSADTGAPVTL